MAASPSPSWKRLIPSKEVEYEQVNDDESVEAHGSTGTPKQRKTPYYVPFLIASNVILLAALVVVLFRGQCSMDKCLRVTSSFTPLFDRGFEPEMRVQKINGSFHNHAELSIARQMPNPAADEQWDEIELARVIPITKDELVRMGKDPRTAVKLENHIWHEGEDMYAAAVDSFHQLHCLNELRKTAYGGYYNRTFADHTITNPTEKWGEGKYELHLNHCVDILFQQLTCSNNFNLLTYDWAETQTNPFPDMSINKMCGNFPKLIEWRKHHTVPIETWINRDLFYKHEDQPQIPWTDET